MAWTTNTIIIAGIKVKDYLRKEVNDHYFLFDLDVTELYSKVGYDYLIENPLWLCKLGDSLYRPFGGQTYSTGVSSFVKGEYLGQCINYIGSDNIQASLTSATCAIDFRYFSKALDAVNKVFKEMGAKEDLAKIYHSLELSF